MRTEFCQLHFFLHYKDFVKMYNSSLKGLTDLLQLYTLIQCDPEFHVQQHFLYNAIINTECKSLLLSCHIAFNSFIYREKPFSSVFNMTGKTVFQKNCPTCHLNIVRLLPKPNTKRKLKSECNMHLVLDIKSYKMNKSIMDYSTINCI